MIFSPIWENPAVVGLILAMPATALGYLGYRRSRGVDEVAKQAGLASSQSTSVGQAIDGLNRVIDALQHDNKVLRDELILLKQGVELVQARLDVVEKENARLERELAKINGATSSGH